MLQPVAIMSRAHRESAPVPPPSNPACCAWYLLSSRSPRIQPHCMSGALSVTHHRRSYNARDAAGVGMSLALPILDDPHSAVSTPFLVFAVLSLWWLVQRPGGTLTLKPISPIRPRMLSPTASRTPFRWHRSFRPRHHSKHHRSQHLSRLDVPSPLPTMTDLRHQTPFDHNLGKLPRRYKAAGNWRGES